MEATIKIPYVEFVALALNALREKNPGIKADTIQYMKRHGCESDGMCYEIPDYVEIAIDLTLDK